MQQTVKQDAVTRMVERSIDSTIYSDIEKVTEKVMRCLASKILRTLSEGFKSGGAYCRIEELGSFTFMFSCKKVNGKSCYAEFAVPWSPTHIMFYNIDDLVGFMNALYEYVRAHVYAHKISSILERSSTKINMILVPYKPEFLSPKEVIEYARSLMEHIKRQTAIISRLLKMLQQNTLFCLSINRLDTASLLFPTKNKAIIITKDGTGMVSVFFVKNLNKIDIYLWQQRPMIAHTGELLCEIDSASRTELAQCMNNVLKKLAEHGINAGKKTTVMLLTMLLKASSSQPQCPPNTPSLTLG